MFRQSRSAIIREVSVTQQEYKGLTSSRLFLFVPHSPMMADLDCRNMLRYTIKD